MADGSGLSGEGAENLARGLGWFSIGIGLMEVLAPGKLARRLGMRRSRLLLATYGLREIGTGIGILSAEDPTPWIWGRVGGDALDLGTLVCGLSGRKKCSVAVAIAAVAGVTALDALCALSLSASGSQDAGGRDTGVSPGDEAGVLGSP